MRGVAVTNALARVAEVATKQELKKIEKGGRWGRACGVMEERRERGKGRGERGDRRREGSAYRMISNTSLVTVSVL